jgi:hypothetical protein
MSDNQKTTGLDEDGPSKHFKMFEMMETILKQIMGQASVDDDDGSTETTVDPHLTLFSLMKENRTDTEEFRQAADAIFQKNYRPIQSNDEVPSVLRTLELSYTDINAATPSGLDKENAKSCIQPKSNKKKKKNRRALLEKKKGMVASLFHYTKEPWKLTLRPPLFYQLLFQGMSQEKLQMKPIGLWLSDDCADMNWKTWSVKEQFRLENITYKTEVLVDLSDNILLLDGSSIDAVEAFHAKYNKYENLFGETDRRLTEIIEVNEAMLQYLVRQGSEPAEIEKIEKMILGASDVLKKNQEMKFLHRIIDWAAVARDYKGILITPYDRSQFSFLGMHRHLGWFSIIDCASACIWDLSSVVNPKTKPSRKVTDLVFDYPKILEEDDEDQKNEAATNDDGTFPSGGATSLTRS